MAEVVKRRTPVSIRVPHNTAGPNRWIPKIRVIGRDSAKRGLLLAGLVIAGRPLPVPPAIISEVPKSVKVIGNTYRKPGNVIRTAPKLQSVPPVTSVRPKPVKVTLSSYRRDGKVYVTSHTHITVTPVTSVRPKLVLIQPDYRRRHLLRQTGSVRSTRVRRTQPLLISSGNVLVAPINIVETWDGHFSTRGWASPQDQINAGYSRFIQPCTINGSYVEIFDFGSIISNIIATVNWNSIAVEGTVATNTSTIETSTDAITWTTPIATTSVFAAALRYVRWTMNFVGSSDKALSYYYNLQCLLNVHREQDGGSASVFAADAGGTVVSFNKAFKAIDTIDLTPVSTVEQKAVYDFAFPVNPTTFKILLFNAAGARIDGTVTWIARGIF